jgi:acyl-ACP thioesterase
MIDRETRRPLGLPEFIQSFQPPLVSPVVDTRAKWPQPVRSSEPYTSVVNWMDLDLNKHASASSYIEWMLRPLDPERLNASELAAIDILFKSEAFLGDEIAVHLGELDAAPDMDDRFTAQFSHLVERPSDETLLATARSAFRASAG